MEKRLIALVIIILFLNVELSLGISANESLNSTANSSNDITITPNLTNISDSVSLNGSLASNNRSNVTVGLQNNSNVTLSNNTHTVFHNQTTENQSLTNETLINETVQPSLSDLLTPKYYSRYLDKTYTVYKGPDGYELERPDETRINITQLRELENQIKSNPNKLQILNQKITHDKVEKILIEKINENPTSSDKIKLLIFLKPRDFFKITNTLNKKYSVSEEKTRSEIKKLLKPYAVDIKSKKTNVSPENPKKITKEDWDKITTKGKELEGINKEKIIEMNEKLAYANRELHGEITKELLELGGSDIKIRNHLSIVSAEVPIKNVLKLAYDENIEKIYYDFPRYTIKLDKSVPTVGASSWWTGGSGYSGSWVDVAIVDTGVDKTHPALEDDAEGYSRTVYQKDFTDDNDNEDYNGHGTHVAGIIASSDSTYTGVAKGVWALIAAKFLGPNSGSSGNSIDAVDWTVNPDGGIADTAEVVSNSWGCSYRPTDDYGNCLGTYQDYCKPDGETDGDTRYLDAVVDFYNNVVVVAAGNDGDCGSTSLGTPADAYNIISVGNIDDQGTTSRSDDSIAGSSSIGPTYDSRKKPDIVAPGTSIKSTHNQWEGTPWSDPLCLYDTNGCDFIDKSGTSMAAPHVSGAAALLTQYGLTNKEVKALLINTADDYGTSGWDKYYGWGSMNLGSAYTYKDYVISSTVQEGSYKLYHVGLIVDGEKATLVWNRHVTYTGAAAPSSSSLYDLNDLDLYLYKESDGSLASSSGSYIDNVEQMVYSGSNFVDGVVKVDAYTTDFSHSSNSESYALSTFGGYTEKSGPSLSPTVINPGKIAPNKNFEVKVDVTNNGDLTAHNVNASLYSLPSGFSIVSGANPQTLGSISTSGTETATWTVTTTADDGFYTLAGTYDSISYGESYGDIDLGFITVDSIPPTITISSPQNDTYTSVTLNYGVSEATSWEGISIDGGVNQSGGNQSIAGLNDGPHYITVYANDTAGNMNSATVWFTMDLGVHNLDNGQDYSTIQEAINDASVGDTIQVDAGTYNENVDVTKSVNLLGAGAGATIVQAASSSDHVFYVTADNVNISGFTVTGAVGSGFDAYAGVRLYNSNNSKIEKVNASNNYFGILVTYSNNNTLTNNIASDNDGPGIQISSSNNNTITYNIVNSNNWDGIQFHSSSDSTLANNTVSDNWQGIYLDSSSNIIITDNTASSNTLNGIYLWNSSSNEITNNTASDTDDGIRLYSSDNNTITANTVNSNNAGISLSSSSNNTLTNNTASNNGYGIYISGSSNSSEIYHNNFINNTNQAYDSSSNTWDDGYTSGGNYWSNWAPPDLNGDGVVDYEYSILGGSNKDRYPLASPNGWVNIVPDTTPPNITVEIPQNRSYPSGDLDYNTTVYELLNWSKASADGQANLTMSNDSETHYYNLSGTHQTLGEGSHNITFYAQDRFDNVNSTTVHFMVDLTFPQIEYVLPTLEDGLNTSTNSIVINVTHNESYPDTFILSWNGTNESYSYSGAYSNITKSSIPDGRYQYYVSANDTAGNSNQTETRIITIDTLPPSVIDIEPLDGYGVNGIRQISAKVTDLGTGVKSVVAKVSNSTYSSIYELAYSSNNIWHYDSWDTSLLNEGSYYNISINATDFVGFSNATESATVVMDRTFPVLNFTSPTPSAGASLSSSTTSVTINVTVVEANPDTFLLSWKDGNHSYTYSGPYKIITMPISSGNSYSFYVWANDTAGNANQTPAISFSVKSSAPITSGGGGGGGGGGESKTVTEYIENIALGETGSVAFDSSKSPYISGIAITVKSKVYNAKISLEMLDKKPSPFFSDPAGLVLSYLKITKSNVPIGAMEKADIKFMVEKDWLKENDINKDAVTLSREVSMNWEKLPTVRLDEDPDYVYYSAETPEFSYFAIAAEKGSGYVEKAVPIETHAPTMAPSTPTPVPTTPAPTVSSVTSAQTQSSSIPIAKIVVVLILIAAIAAGAYVYSKRVKV